jgi:cell division protein FtsB
LKKQIMQSNEMIINVVTGFVTAGITWYAARRKNRAESYVSELDAVERAVKVWRELGEGMQKKYESLHDEVEILRGEVRGLSEENKELKKENQRLLQQIKTLTGGKG